MNFSLVRGGQAGGGGECRAGGGVGAPRDGTRRDDASHPRPSADGVRGGAAAGPGLRPRWG